MPQVSKNILRGDEFESSAKVQTARSSRKANVIEPGNTISYNSKSEGFKLKLVLTTFWSLTENNTHSIEDRPSIKTDFQKICVPSTF